MIAYAQAAKVMLKNGTVCISEGLSTVDMGDVEFDFRYGEASILLDFLKRVLVLSERNGGQVQLTETLPGSRYFPHGVELSVKVTGD